jgi:hypothetical protein
MAVASNRVKWVAATLIGGAFPFAARAAVWAISTAPVPLIVPSDLIAFGLVLHTSTVNELDRVKKADANWRAIQIALAFLFCGVYCVFYALGIFSEATKGGVNATVLMGVLMGMCIASLAICVSVFQRLP